MASVVVMGVSWKAELPQARRRCGRGYASTTPGDPFSGSHKLPRLSPPSAAASFSLLHITATPLYSSVSGDGSLKKRVVDVMPIATGLEREELEGKNRFDMDAPAGPFGTKKMSMM
uniref:Uncharacterized protein n=1 Tax=Musa acuminata subsp. malaccensis TaxID=214687 RepID=A0A804JVA3_MUSAM